MACNTPENDVPSPQEETNMNETMTTDQDSITREEAMALARQWASQVYHDLTPYEIETTLKDGNWHVDYELKDPGMVGGGPHFVISASTGELISSRFEQ
ncbi:MAG: hypothetical protein KDD36_12850 [Flavobacteriales bacterium]|nr:hypothetical protein [Flavobacteriales bacterium]